MERLHHEGSGLGRGLMQLKVVNMAMYDPCQPMALDTVNGSSGILFFGHLGSMPLGVDQEVNSSIQPSSTILHSLAHHAARPSC